MSTALIAAGHTEPAAVKQYQRDQRGPDHFAAAVPALMTYSGHSSGALPVGAIYRSNAVRSRLRNAERAISAAPIGDDRRRRNLPGLRDFRLRFTHDERRGDLGLARTEATAERQQRLDQRGLARQVPDRRVRTHMLAQRGEQYARIQFELVGILRAEPLPADARPTSLTATKAVPIVVSANP